MASRRKTARIEISPAERLQLIGLKAVADRLRWQLEEVERAAGTITGEIDGEGKPDHTGVTTDFLWAEGMAVDDLLRDLDLRVSEPAIETPAPAPPAAGR